MTNPSSSKPNLEALLEHGGWVRALAASLVSDRATADDLEQKTWLAAVEHPPKHGANPRAWLGSVVRNVAGMHWREQKSRRRREQFVAQSQWNVETQAQAAHQPDHLVERMDTFRKLALALSALEEPFATTLYLRFFEELTLRAIAEQMQVSESAVHARLQRGLLLMRQELTASVGGDWRQRCMIFGIPLKTAPVGAITLGVAMTMKTKIAGSLAALALITLFAVAPWESKEDVKTPAEIASAPTVSLPVAILSAEKEPGTKQISRMVEPASGLSQAGSVAVTVVDAAGRPVPQVRLVPWVGEELREEKTTDASGQATLQACVGSGGIAVLAPGYRVVHRVEEFVGDPIRIELKEGFALSGRVEFQRAQADRTDFVLWHISPTLQSPKEMPLSVKEQLKERGASMIGVYIPLQPDGSFTVRGLPSNWEGRLKVPRGFIAYASSEGEVGGMGDFVHLKGLSTSLVIQVMELPYFSGRVVTPDGTKGVADAGVIVQPYFTAARDEPGSMFGLGGVSDADGYFRVPVSVGSEKERIAWSEDANLVRPYAAEVSLVQCGEWADVEFAKMDLGLRENPWELGEFAVGERKELSVRVLNENGQALKGALVKTYEIAERTNDAGETTAFLADDTTQVLVAASGYRPLAAELPESSGQTLEVQLEPANKMRVKWDLPEGVDLGEVYLWIESEEDVYWKGNSGLNSLNGDLRREESKRSYWHGGTRNGMQYRIVALEANQNEVLLWGLQTETSLQFKLSTRKGEAFTNVESITMMEGEWKEIELRFERLPLQISGLVTDQAGNPLGNVEVNLPSPDGTLGRALTKQDGLFHLGGLNATEIDMRVSKAGYAAQILENLAPSQSGEGLTLVLEPERVVTVFLRDSEGKNYLDGWIQSPGQNMDGSEQDNGGYVLAQNPRSSFHLKWELGGAKGEVLIPAGMEEYVVSVPRMTSATVDIPYNEAMVGQQMQAFFYNLDDASEFSQAEPLERGIWLDPAKPSWQINIPSFLPGNYRVEFHQWQGGPEIFEYQLVQDPIYVTAIPNQNLEISFTTE
ncbi:MAG: sigma-70 family RNA polymerase sigma factor [Planctomycetota bacterium]